MSAVEWAMGLVALVVGVGILYFIFTQGPTVSTSNGPPTLTVEGLPVAFVGVPHTITVRVTGHAGENILVRIGEETQTFPCPHAECSFSLSHTFTTLGNSLVHAESGYLQVDWGVDVQTKTSVCIDGTPEGSCSTPPLRCVNHSLITDCVTCGCPSGESCASNTCVKVPFSFTITLGALPPLYTTSVSTIPFTITNTSSFPASGLFVGRVRWYDSTSTLLGETPQQFLVDALSSAATQSFSIPVLLPSNATTLNVEWFPAGDVYDDATLLAQLSPPQKIAVVVDTTPPSPPGALTYSLQNDSLTLAWGASSSNDVKEYVLYQENAATGGFTTYATLGTTSALTYSIPTPTDDTSFVVKARDGAGNESAPSSPLVVSAS